VKAGRWRALAAAGHPGGADAPDGRCKTDGQRGSLSKQLLRIGIDCADGSRLAHPLREWVHDWVSGDPAVLRIVNPRLKGAGQPVVRGSGSGVFGMDRLLRRSMFISLVGLALAGCTRQLSTRPQSQQKSSVERLALSMVRLSMPVKLDGREFLAEPVATFFQEGKPVPYREADLPARMAAGQQIVFQLQAFYGDAQRSATRFRRSKAKPSSSSAETKNCRTSPCRASLRRACCPFGPRPAASRGPSIQSRGRRGLPRLTDCMIPRRTPRSRSISRSSTHPIVTRRSAARSAYGCPPAMPARSELHCGPGAIF